MLVNVFWDFFQSAVLEHLASRLMETSFVALVVVNDIHLFSSLDCAVDECKKTVCPYKAALKYTISISGHSYDIR